MAPYRFVPNGTALITLFDVLPDGMQIVFDRLRDSADIVLMNLAR